MKSCSIVLFFLIFMLVSPSITKGQNVIKVFDAPQDYVNRTGKFALWLSPKSMLPQAYERFSSLTDDSPWEVKGYLLRVYDGRFDYLDGNGWGNSKGIVARPNINIWVNSELGQIFRQQINGAKLTRVSFKIKERFISSGDEKIKVYFAEITELRPK